MKLDKVPEIDCALTISFNETVHIESILSALAMTGIQAPKVKRPCCVSEVCIEIASIKNEKCWHIGDALDKMFLQVNGTLASIKEIIDLHHGKTYIDIAYYQYGTSPSLVLDGENMRKIRFLEANISVDPF